MVLDQIMIWGFPSISGSSHISAQLTNLYLKREKNICFFPRHVSWQLNEKRNSRDLNRCLYGVLVSQETDLLCLSNWCEVISLTTSGLLQIKTVADQLKNVGDLVNIRTCFFIIIIIGKANFTVRKERWRASVCWLTSQIPSLPVTQSQSWDPRNRSRSPTWVAGPETTGTHLLPVLH